jgi:feruloyl-CoA synthase
MAASWLDDPALLAPRRVLREDSAGGGFILRSPEPLHSPVRCVGDWLEHWAQHTPRAVAVAEPRPGGGWQRLSWRELREQVGVLAQGLLDLKLPPAAPLLVLSDNSLQHLLLLLAGMHVGVPVCSVSSGYTRLAGGDYSRLNAVFAKLRPGLVFASDAPTYGPAMAGLPGEVWRVFGTLQASPAARAARQLALADLGARPESPQVAEAFAKLGPHTHAKYLLTSGSTGQPKLVINTHRMLCANQQMLAQTLRFLSHDKPVLLDWLPWSHTFGANHNTNLVLAHGGTLYIDDGRPLPGLIDKTMAHLREVKPNLYFNVPRGYEMLLPALEADEGFARAFFGRLRMLFYAGAGMPVSTWQRLDAVAQRLGGEPPWFTTSWGSTETAPAVTFAHWRLDGPGVIGLPMPGAEVKFVPVGDKLELRVRGPNVTPGYLHDEAATRAAFDEEGYYRIGDAGRLADADDPSQGIVFDGRVAEDFKLGNGSWVSVGTLRLKLLAAFAPWAQELVLTGHDGPELGLLIFPSEAARTLDAQALRGKLRAVLQALATQGGGATQTPRRVLLLSEPPSLAAGEMTDKGYLNQRLTLQCRAADVARLHAQQPSADVITTP